MEQEKEPEMVKRLRPSDPVDIGRSIRPKPEPLEKRSLPSGEEKKKKKKKKEMSAEAWAPSMDEEMYESDKEMEEMDKGGSKRPHGEEETPPKKRRRSMRIRSCAGGAHDL